MRFRVVLVFALFASSLSALAAVKPEEAIDHPALLAQLEYEARTARPREPCYLSTQIVHILTDWKLPIRGTMPWQNAQVTAGGVATAEIDPRTMESKLVPGLFLCG